MGFRWASFREGSLTDRYLLDAMVTETGRRIVARFEVCEVCVGCDFGLGTNDDFVSSFSR